MTNGTPELSTLDELRCFVEQTICDQKQLLRGAFPLHEKLLVRNGEPCGLHFTLNGLRAVQFSAIWDAATRSCSMTVAVSVFIAASRPTVLGFGKSWMS